MPVLGGQTEREMTSLKMHFLSSRNFLRRSLLFSSVSGFVRVGSSGRLWSDDSDDGFAGSGISPRFAFDARDSLGSAQGARATTFADALRLCVDRAPPAERVLLPLALVSLLPLSPSFAFPSSRCHSTTQQRLTVTLEQPRRLQRRNCTC